MAKQIKIKNKFKSFMIVAMIALMLPIQTVFAGDGRYLAFLFDTDSYDIKPTSIIHETKNTERDMLGCLDPNNPYFSISAGAKEGTICGAYATTKEEENTLYTYPKGDKMVNGYDQQMVEWMGRELTNGINQALHLVSNYTTNKINSKEKLISTSIELSNCVAKQATTTAEFSCLGLTMRFATDDDLTKSKIVLKTEGPSSGSKASNYLVIKADKKESIVRYSVPTGYLPGQYLYTTNANNEQKRSESWSSPPEFMSWAHVVYSAKEHYKNSITMQDYKTLVKKDAFTESIVGFFENMINGAANALGLYSVEELTLNTGLREGYYYKGLMPYTWFRGINILYWVFQVIAVFILGFSILNVVRKRQVATFNPAVRASLKDDLMNFVYAIVLLILFVPIFWLLATFNITLIDALKTLVPESAKLTTSMSSNAIVGLLIVGIYFFICIRINVTYIIRAAMISILYLTSPFFISCLAFGKKGRDLFQNWLQELVANIFLQLCNALVMVFFLMIVGVGSRGIERLILLYAFIPLNKWFKENIMVLKSGTDNVSDVAAKGFGNSMTGFAAAGLGGLAAVAGGGNFLKGLSGDKKNMEGKSVRNEDDNADNVKQFNGFDKDSSSTFKKSDVNDYRFNANKIKAETGKGSEQASPYDAERMLKSTVRTLGSAAVSTAALGLSFGAAAGGFDGKALGAIGTIAAVNTGTFGKDMVHEGKDLSTQIQMGNPSTEIRSSNYREHDFNEYGFRFEQDSDNSVNTMLDDKMIGSYTTQAFENAQKNVGNDTLVGIYNNDKNIIGWKNTAFDGNAEIDKNKAVFNQKVDNIFTPKDLNSELIGKQLETSSGAQQQSYVSQQDRFNTMRNDNKKNRFNKKRG